MQKRLLSIISIVLTATLLLGILPAVQTVRAEGEGTAARGDYIYALSADPDTGSVPAEFGTPANNGRVWTDKSVAVNGDHFDVNLKVLAQEYISSYETTFTSAVAADVLFILDFTGSMYSNSDIKLDNGSTVTRLSAMVDAANEAIDIITETNPNNRIKVFRFSGSTTNCAQYSKEIMPLAHYTSSSTATDTKDKYIRLSNNRTVASSTTLLKDGETFTFSESTQNNTCTQYGIAAGVKSFIDDINAETDNSMERRPYVIMLTDGEPTLASKNWYSEDPGDLRSNAEGNSDNYKNERMATDTILTSAIWKDRLAEAYEAYNNNGQDIDVKWFNIGLGIAEPEAGTSPNYTACLINPYYLVDVDASGVTNTTLSSATSAERIKYYLSQSDYAPAYTAKDYSKDDAYTYINEGDGFVTFANTYSVLMNAFVTLANIIKAGSMEYTIPIIYHEGSGDQSSDVVFTDVIGEGMFVDEITLKPNGKPPVTGDDSDNDGKYTFSGYNTTVKITEGASGQQTLEWTIPAKEVAMYTFADRDDLTSGNYVAADPTTLTYTVEVTDEIGEGPGYTNAFDASKNPRTTVTYEIPGDNTYYYNVNTDPSTHLYVSSSLKSGIDSSTDKTVNTTDSASTSSAYSYTAVNDATNTAYAVTNVTLGNNGKATLAGYHTNLAIQVVKKWKDDNGDEIADTSALPAVTVKLYRTANGSSTTEFVESKELNNSNSYTAFWNVPRKDGGGNIYAYSVTEDSPDGYYLESNSGALNGEDGTITVTNREMPASGVVTVKKLWKNKIGATYSDTSSFSPINIELWKKVTVRPIATVKVYCTDSSNNNYLVEQYKLLYGSTLSFSTRAYIQRAQNAQNATFTRTIDGTTVSVVSSSGSANIPNVGTRNYRQTEQQSFTVTGPMEITYTVSRAMNTGQMDKPCSLEDVTVTDPTDPSTYDTPADDQQVGDTELNFSNNWSGHFDNLPEFEVADDKTYLYSYYVKEISEVAGFTASYSANNTDGITGGNLVITNTSTSNIPILPETGGINSGITLMLGVLLAMIAILGAVMLIDFSPQKKRRKAVTYVYKFY